MSTNLASAAEVIGVMVLVGNFGLQIATFLRQGEEIKAANKRAQTLDQVHNLVNSQSEELKTALKTIAHTEGVAEGVASAKK